MCCREAQLYNDGQLTKGLSDEEAISDSAKGLECHGRKKSLLYMDSREMGRKEITCSKYGQLFQGMLQQSRIKKRGRRCIEKRGQKECFQIGKTIACLL